jgi:hypothetical protein
VERVVVELGFGGCWGDFSLPAVEEVRGRLAGEGGEAKAGVQRGGGRRGRGSHDWWLPRLVAR